MAPRRPQRRNPSRLPIGQCEICRTLGDVETSFTKWGWNELDRPLPAAAGRLVPVEDTSSYESQRHHVRRCPLCSTFYRYDWTYEYLANGSEDEEVLMRLTPAEAGGLLTDEEYERRMTWMRECLESPDAPTRRYAAQSLAAHYWVRGEAEQVLPYLLLADAEAVKGVLGYLARAEGPLTPLAPVLCKLCQSPDEEIAGRAKTLLEHVAP